MRAIVLHNPSDFRLQQVTIPAIRENEVLVRVAYCAICATDIRVLEGRKTHEIHYPCIIGHEISGWIERVGSDVRAFAPHDRVNISPIIPCGKCRSCLTGRENACENRIAIGYELDGGFAEYVRMPATAAEAGNLLHLPDNFSLEEATLIEPLACCIHGIHRAAISPSDHVLIIGMGAIGQMFLQLCRLCRVEMVAASDLLENRLRTAEQFGADMTFSPRKEDIADRMNAQGIQQFDKIIVTCTDPEEIARAIPLCANGGTMLLFSGYSARDTARISPNPIHYNELLITGSRSYTRAEYQAAFHLILNGEIHVKPLISGIYPIEEFLTAYRMHKSGEGFKYLIHP